MFVNNDVSCGRIMDRTEWTKVFYLDKFKTKVFKTLCHLRHDYLIKYAFFDKVLFRKVQASIYDPEN